MNNVLNFTKTALEALPIKESQYEVRDTKTPGLILRVNPGGVKTFMFFRRVDRMLKRVKIGRLGEITVEAARKGATNLNGQMISGLNISRNPQRQELTFQQLFDKYYIQYAMVHTKRPEDNKATLEFHLMPKIGPMKVSKVTREFLKEHHLAQGMSRGKQQANRILTIVSAVYNFGMREGLYNGSNPCLGIKRFKSRSRDRFLNGDELKLFFEALKHEEQIYQDFFMLCIFIGARKSTMLSMKYNQIDFELKRFRLSEEETKNGEVNVYVLSDAALEILQRRHVENQSQEHPSEFVFPGDSEDGHLKDPKRAFTRIKERMEVNDIWIHDLRRTLGSYMAINNTSLQIIGQALNHKSTVSTQIYARLSKEPILDAVNQAASKITSLLS